MTRLDALPAPAAIGRQLGLAAIALIVLLPFFWIGMSSFRPAEEIFRHAHRLSWATILPQEITFENYARLASSDFRRALFNSIFVATATAALGVFVNSAAGFAFAVLRFPLRRFLFGVVLLSFMMPFEAIVIPLYLLVRWLGWIDTYRALILPDVASGFAVFLFRQFFVKVSRELFEAARVDGASWWHVYWRIALPLSWPTVATAALMQFIVQWDAFFWPLVVASSPEHGLVQVAIARNMEFERTNFGRLFSSMTVASLVAIVPFLAFQRWYVRTIIASGLK